MEISINCGAFADIRAAAGSFISGGYNATISSCYQNPLAGRSAWSGLSDGFGTGSYVTTGVNMPASANGQSIQLRWRLGGDSAPDFEAGEGDTKKNVP